MVKIVSDRLKLSTKGNRTLINITEPVMEKLQQSKLIIGNVTVFVVGSTAAITTFEYEPGLSKDMLEFYDRLAPEKKSYHHDATWGDANGFSHVRAAFTGPSLTIPFEEGRLLLGTWQQVVLADFDNRPRERIIIIHIIGE
ncbi:MAG TPA: secondary thiamine-phosphate synthase enzyme YjbQ [Syntrophorhabdales bacterium]|nr:secondary thiamine-phosphate synthase enzyme YjbQ [Syntrophorhabdales bacterium]